MENNKKSFLAMDVGNTLDKNYKKEDPNPQ